MRTLVLGGMSSGKSSWAESVLAGQSGVRYLATGPRTDSDTSWADRLAEHRARRPPDWTTVETADVPGELRAVPDTPTLVDDLGGWMTGLLDSRGWDSAPWGPAAGDLADAVGAFVAPLVLVSPEVGLSVVPATAAGRRFADELGRLNQRIAAACDRVVLVVAGQPMQVKG